MKNNFVLFVLILVLTFVFCDVSSVKAQGSEKIRILLVPGHESNFGGTEFRGIKERDMAVELSKNLKKLLEEDGIYEVFVTRDGVSWSPTFKNYFKKNWNGIISWKNKMIKEDMKNISDGLITKPVQSVYHNSVSKNIAVHLYGITKWANENKIDVMVHIHFNDNPEHIDSNQGEYSGFAIYVPVDQYKNSFISRNIAQSVFNKLLETNSVSNMKNESVGIVSEPSLIAIGAHNSSSVPSILIEYGYIYESKFLKSDSRHKLMKDLAQETYNGLKEYFVNR